MLAIHLPETTRDRVSWAAFWAAFAILPLVVVVGLRPSVERRVATGAEAVVAHPGRMLIDQRKADCQQISFDNDTAAITASATVSCTKRPQLVDAAGQSSSDGGAFGSMRNALSAAGQP